MLNCKMGRHQILGLFCFLVFLHSSFPFTSSLCPPNQRDELLHVKNSLVLDSEVSYSCFFSDPTTSSWNEGVDCCNWDGVTCDDVGNVIVLNLTCMCPGHTLYSNSSLLLPKLEVLVLPSCNLTEFPYFLKSLKILNYLNLSSNRIKGEIPRWFWGISQLETLDLSNNFLDGVIPQLQPRLSYVDLRNNSFQGPLPILPPSTSYFDASDNGFNGEISSSICQLSSLEFLSLSNNNLSGNMPPCFGDIIYLSNLDLSNNKLQGPLPRSLVKCIYLKSLVLSQNEFSDIFPDWLGALQLFALDLRSNKFHGRINSIAFEHSFVALKSLIISNNNFVGQWPMDVFSNTLLVVIDLSNNNFGGSLPQPSRVTSYYAMASNKITGEIPSWICDATDLKMIDLSNNSLTGSLPWCLINFTVDLSVLNLRRNHLEGIIPQSFASTNSLTTLDLSRNRFEGTLPQSLVRCEALEVLDLSDNKIEDTFPKWLGTLEHLKVLVLSSNNFKGSLDIPWEAHLFSSLHILDLSNNNFGGTLPANLIMNLKAMERSKSDLSTSLYMTQSFQNASYENSVTVTLKGQKIELTKILTIFTIIDLSNNSFQGDIPKVIGHLHSLIGLNLSHNHLTGFIPSSLGNLTNLGWLDLSSNKLSGRIPRNLGDLAALGYLNLSKNLLTDRIPQDKQLGTFSNDSFNGNPDLCGFPLTKACPGDAPPPPSPSSTFNRKGHESWSTQKVAWIGYVSGFVIGISISYICFEIGRPRWLAQGVRKLEKRTTQWMEKPKILFEELSL
ncbi:hypothetical protein BT93_F0953 [Corymbia citriodora subsp. variegata]|nr:hypothetical protein BT93_F0953 [Corymbia citriodora subsp. variegata]